MLSSILLTIRLAAILIVASNLSSPAYTVRESAERELHAHVYDLFGWQAVRSLWTTEQDTEVRARLEAVWSKHTARRATELLPGWAAMWPQYDGPDRLAAAWDVSADIERRIIEYAKSSDFYIRQGSNDEFSYHCVPLVPELALAYRAASRQWAVRELAVSGDDERVRKTLIKWSQEDRSRDRWDNLRLYDDGGLHVEAWTTVVNIAPELLNPRYYDGRREPYPGDDAVIRAQATGLPR